MGLLFEIVISAAPILFVAALIMRRFVARGSRFPRVQRAVGALALAAAVTPGIWLMASGKLRSELRESVLTVFVALTIPIVLCLPPLIARRSVRTLWTASAAVVLAAFCLVGGFSIGPLYTPADALMIAAGVIGFTIPGSNAQLAAEPEPG
jgi:uncharacterized membrane protein